LFFFESYTRTARICLIVDPPRYKTPGDGDKGVVVVLEARVSRPVSGFLRFNTRRKRSDTALR
jgi:hypothetical protein